MYLVFDQVYELHHIDVAHRDRLIERLARAPVIQNGLAQRGRRYLRLAVQPLRLFLHSAKRVVFNLAIQILAQPGFKASPARLAGDAAVAEHRFVVIPAPRKPKAHCAHIYAPHTAAVVRRHINGARLVDNPSARQGVFDIRVFRAVEHLRIRIEAEVARRPAQMRFKHLPEVHSRRHPDGVQDDIDRRAVRQEGHILFRQYLRHHALVAVPPRHLVPFGYLARLRYPQPHHLLDAGRKIRLVRAVQHPDADNLAALAVRHAQRSVFHIARLFPEYRAQQLLFGTELGFALGRYLAHQNIARLNLRPNADDAVFIQIAQALFPHIRDVPRYVFRPKLGVARLYFVLLYVNRSELIVLHQAAAEDDGILEVIPPPAHKRDQHILPQRKLALPGG